MYKLTPILLVILLINCTRNDDSLLPIDINHRFNFQKLIEDYTILRTALEEAHPGIYRYTTKEKFDSLFDSVKSQIRNGMTEIEFFRLISPVIAQLRCGHTGISPSQNYRNFMKEGNKYFPLQLKFISDKAYVLKSYHQDELIPQGSEIVSINQRSIAKLTGTLFRMISSDGNIQTAKYRRLDEELSELYFLYINPQDSFNIEYIPKSDNVRMTKSLPAKSWHDIRTYKSSYMSRQKEPLRFEIDENSHAAIMTIVTFIPRIIKTYFGDFYSFIDSSFALIDEKNIQNLIIDVRGNNGGDEHYFSHLLAKFIDRSFRIFERIDVPTSRYSFLEYTQHGIFFNWFNSLNYVRNEKTGRYELKGKAGWHKLITPHEDHFTGRIYILTDGWSFSGASDFCAIAHYNANDRITFIGEETGGAYYGNNSGDWLQLILPNTHIRVSIPIRSYLLAVFDYPYFDRGVIPNYYVISEIKDILNNKDTHLGFTLNLIEVENKKH